MKELQIYSEPTIRREKFNLWMFDLKNILSTNRKTAKILQNYPSQLAPMDPIIDLYLQSNIGSNFISDAFKKWSDEVGMTLTIVGPKHQEYNGFLLRLLIELLMRWLGHG